MMPGWGAAFGGMGGGGGGHGGGHHGGMGGYGAAARRFEEQYHCYSVAYADKAHLEKGDKILLPPSAFDMLARLQVDYPMLFQLRTFATNTATGVEEEGRTTHSGVLEFTAEEGCVYIPFWMMQNLLIEEGALISVKNVSLPKATFVKLQPQSVDFLEISNPRAVLEHALRNYSCVTVGDVIQLPYNKKNYHFLLKEVKPHPAACIIETDCNVDFDAPVGYKEPERRPSPQQSLSAEASKSNSQRSSACPSPTTLSTASSMQDGTTVGDEGAAAGDGDNAAASKPPGVRIVNGKIVRPDAEEVHAREAEARERLLADRTGATGVQRNAAVPSAAPEADYWAVAAGDGARLDGKAPTVLKDKEGNALDVRKLRAEAAARRAAAAAAEQQKASSATAALAAASGGKTLDGSEQPAAAAASAAEAAKSVAQPSSSSSLVSKRKSRTGSKFSRLKQSGVAFQGAAKSFK